MLITSSLRVLCFGDSLTAGFSQGGSLFHPYGIQLKASLEKALPKWNITTDIEGLGGDQAVSPPGLFLSRMEELCRSHPSFLCSEILDEKLLPNLVYAGMLTILSWSSHPEIFDSGDLLIPVHPQYTILLTHLPDQDTPAHAPYDWAIILGGTNDLNQDRIPKDIFPALEKVWSIPLGNNTKLLALTVTDCGYCAPEVAPRRNDLNTRILEHVADN